MGAALRRDTRRRLLDAAEREFGTHGYAATTVSRLAEVAGVSAQTLYLTWGSKRALLRGYLERVLSGESATPEDVARRALGMTPRERVADIARLVAETASRAAKGWSVYRDAAAMDAEIAADWDELQQLRHRLFTSVLGDIPAGVLASGVTVEEAVDTVWTIASPASYDLLVDRLEYTLDEFREWMSRTVTAAVLAPTGAPTPARVTPAAGWPRPA